MSNRHAPPPKRSSRPQPQRRLVHVLTEGRRTEVEYFAKWASEVRDRVTVTFDPFHGAPLSLVERAADLVEQRRRAFRRGRDEAQFDEIWCVFDRDDHPFVAEAIALANRHNIGVSYSNPCFELWLVLHTTDLRRHTERQAVQATSAQLGLTQGKGLHPDAWPTLRPTWELADARSAALDQLHDGNGSPPGSNPSTSVGRLVKSLQRT